MCLLKKQINKSSRTNYDKLLLAAITLSIYFEMLRSAKIL